MPDEEQVREVMQRLSTAAFFYYPEIHADDPDYALARDLDWIFGDDFDVPDDIRDALRDLASRTIIDPSQYRREMFDGLMQLLPDES